MRTRPAALAVALLVLTSSVSATALVGLFSAAQAQPRPNVVAAVCANGVTYTGTAGSPNAAAAHFDRGAFIVKAAEGYPAFNGVPRRLLTRCDVYLNGEFFIDGYLLLNGPRT